MEMYKQVTKYVVVAQLYLLDVNTDNDDDDDDDDHER